MSSAREATEIGKSLAKKTDGNYRQRILQFLETNDRFSVPVLFPGLKSIEVQRERLSPLGHGTTREESSRKLSRNNNIHLRHTRSTRYRDQSDHQWLLDLGKDHSYHNDLAVKEETGISEVGMFKISWRLPYSEKNSRLLPLIKSPSLLSDECEVVNLGATALMELSVARKMQK